MCIYGSLSVTFNFYFSDIGTASGLTVFTTLAYGLYFNSHKQKMWSTIENIGSSLKDPWLLLGEFNCNLALDDKMGGRTLLPMMLGILQNAVNPCRFVDLKISSFGLR